MKENLSIITPLKGADRVRKRPAVIFGDDGYRGCIAALEFLLDIFKENTEEIELTVFEDNSIAIKSKDKGFYINEELIDGKPAWFYDFCEIAPEPREQKEEFVYNLGLYSSDSFYLCCVQYASRFMKIEAVRSGVKKTLNFERGSVLTPLIKENTKESDGTYIYFKPDEEVFKDITIPKEEIAALLKQAAITLKGLKCALLDKRENYSELFYYPQGAKDYITQEENLITPIYTKEIKAKGKDRYNKREYEAKAKVLIAFTKEEGKTEAYHNCKFLAFGGSHKDALEEQIEKFTGWVFANSKISFEKIKKNLVIILITSCTPEATTYKNGARNSISNKMITDMAADLIGEDFRFYLTENSKTIQQLLQEL